MKLIEELEARGLIHQVTEQQEKPLPELLETPQVIYAGFDPTAPSLHVGNLVPLLGLRRFQEAGHRVIALAGGATGMVGDPSGRSTERNLQDREALAANLRGIKGQLERLLDFGGGRAKLVDNLQWTESLSFLDVLRDVGKHFTLNTMLRKDSVRSRLEREGEGISYTEFSYMLLQAHDFLWLFEHEGCVVQIGGSDQWGNMTAGVELIRRKLGKPSYAVTFPLLTNADGSKFGKSAAGAVWLDPKLTSPFAFRQFWFKSSDADVITRLKYFSFLPLDEIAALERAVQEKSAPNQAQQRMAEHMTALVHGADEARKVERAAEVLFDPKADLREVPAEYLADAFEGAPVVPMPRARFQGDGVALIDLVVDVVYAGEQKRGAARRDLQQNAIALNGQKVTDEARPVTGADLLHDEYLVLRKGKKSYFLVRVTD